MIEEYKAAPATSSSFRNLRGTVGQRKVPHGAIDIADYSAFMACWKYNTSSRSGPALRIYISMVRRFRRSCRSRSAAFLEAFEPAIN